jgi:RNA polymerase sigma-70 factor (ECF subfamily)
MGFPEERRDQPPSRKEKSARDLSPEALRSLAQRFAQRDRAAFEEVYHAFRETVFVIGVLELGDAEEAHDLVQETFRRAWSSARTLAEPDRLRPWLFAIARNLCVDLGKRSQRRPLPVEDIPEWRLKDQPREAPLPAAIRREKAQRVQELLNTVPQRFRVVLALRLLEERSYQEISATLDMPLHGVKNAIARGGRILMEKIRNTPDLMLEGD